MSYLDRLDQIDFENTPPQPTAKAAISPYDSKDSNQGRQFSKTQSDPDLYGWTLEQIRDHCHPGEWAEIKENHIVLEAVAANLREYPFLWAPTFRDRYQEAEQAADRGR